MTTERKATAGGRWADTKDLKGANGNGDVDETVPLNDSKKKENSSKTNNKDGQRKTGRSKNGYLCRVLLLDGNEFDVEVPTSAVGQVLFQKVCEHISLAEPDYFSLSYRDRTDVKFWLNHTKKIGKQIGNGSWVFAFEVKFYPTEPEVMKEDLTRFLLFLQLRTDILTGKLPCSFVTHALLGSYAIQSDLGDYETDEHGGGTGYDYLKSIDIAPNQGEDLLEKISDLHKTHRGLMPEEAELEYLNNAKKLAMYGIEMHNAKVVSKDSTNGDNVVIGVCASGLMVYKDKLRIHRFSWPKILKISYKRNIFKIKVRPGEYEQVRGTLAYKVLNYTMAKKLWKIAVEHHAFFRLKEPEPGSRTAFPLFGSKFRYSGRTQYQSANDAKNLNRTGPRVDRKASRRFVPARPVDNSGPMVSVDRTEQVITSDEMPVTTLDLRNRKKGVPYATSEDDPNLTGDDSNVSLMRNAGNPNYSQAAWSKPNRGGQGGNAPAFQGTPYDQQGFQLCDQSGKPLKKNHKGPIYVKFGTPLAQSEHELYDMYGNPVPNNYNGRLYDRLGNTIAESPDELFNRYGNGIMRPGHKGPVFGNYGRPYLHELFDTEHNPIKPGHVGPVYDAYGYPLVPLEMVYGRSPTQGGYDAVGHQLCDEYGYPLKPSHDGRIYIKYGAPVARGVHELCDINGEPIHRDHDGPVFDRWGNMIAPGLENLYDEYGNRVDLNRHDGPIFGRYGAPLMVDLFDKDGKPIRPGHRGQVYDMHRNLLLPLEVCEDGTYGDPTTRRKGPPVMEKHVDRASRLSGINTRDSKGNMIVIKTHPSEADEEGLPPYQEDHRLLHGMGAADRDSMSPYSVTTTTRTTTRTYRGPDGTMVTEHKTEKDGHIETRIEKKTTIITQVEDQAEIDFDRLLSLAISGETQLNPDLAVEKIEIHTERE